MRIVVTLKKMGDGLFDRSPHSFAGLPPEFKKKFPEVEKYSMFTSGDLGLKMNQSNPNGVDQFIFHGYSHLASFRYSYAVRQSCGHQRGHPDLVLTKGFAGKFFRGENPIGKVIEDVPFATNLNITLLLELSSTCPQILICEQKL